MTTPPRRPGVASVPLAPPVTEPRPPESAPGAHRAGRVLAGLVAVALVTGFVAWIAMSPVPPRNPPLTPWITVQVPGYRIDLPAPPTTQTVAFGAGHVTTAVDGPNAFTVVWFPAQDGVQPTAVLSRALQALRTTPAAITLTRTGVTGPFASAEVAARLPAAYLHGRLLVVGRRAYLVAEITPGEASPPDLTRLLSGFDPDPAAA